MAVKKSPSETKLKPIAARSDEAASRAFMYNHGEKHDPKKHGAWYQQKEFIGYPDYKYPSTIKYTENKIKASDADIAKRSAAGRSGLVKKYETEAAAVKAAKTSKPAPSRVTTSGKRKK
jgi:hypothetical protein